MSNSLTFSFERVLSGQATWLAHGYGSNYGARVAVSSSQHVQYVKDTFDEGYQLPKIFKDYKVSKRVEVTEVLKMKTNWDKIKTG